MFLNILFIIVVSVQGLYALKCYKCISVSCPEQPAFCSAVKDFAFRQIPDYYYYMENGLQFCPDPSNLEEWAALKTASYLDCGEDKDGEATCTLGRFRITTLVTSSQTNITSYGTVLGCAKRKLLEHTRATLKQKNECSVMDFVSPVRNSLKHYMEMEHCPMITDMCHQEDYCVKPEDSVVKSFKDVHYGINAPMGIIIGVVCLLAALVAILTFAGIKYNA